MDRLMNAPALEQLRFLQAIKDQGPDLRGEAVADLEAEEADTGGDATQRAAARRQQCL